jgi:hypothetical protein
MANEKTPHQGADDKKGKGARDVDDADRDGHVGMPGRRHEGCRMLWEAKYARKTDLGASHDFWEFTESFCDLKRGGGWGQRWVGKLQLLILQNAFLIALSPLNGSHDYKASPDQFTTR